ncbi:uncharacterized protein LOC133463946 [Cololabis saira]|uniref:uncharacterized protein LOC133463946 n=1 Tax=Cololabis saira TaxID=129043 RepID=UPI002AD24DCD|nr:uncharacterized protein LOC133463946 [Cololabis saira]XP_061601754.1 uncharacterized protein LOC133463946 [Cololabis saira]XP_061601755.1 uncharacterized protein LOC133463946 [Cololabis saira]XP_061601756.1 uncharacterized protein LOC133463946 [Cololabis saira]XP_061601757.1 uncharacterized protein LOC133463946 [Cololabis saira]
MLCRTVLVSALLCAAWAADEIRYFLDGGSLTISPQPVSAPITVITWKCSGDVVAEWVKDKIELEYLGRFKGHASLVLATGELTVTNMNPQLAGTYTVEINYQVQPVGYKAVILKSVPTPSVAVQPLACTKDRDVCALLCEGDVAGAEPITVFWREDDGAWSSGEERKEILNNNFTRAVQTFSCRLENPVSSGESEPFQNPFYVETPGSGAVVGGVIGGLVVLVLIGAGVFVYLKRKKRSQNLDLQPAA